MLELSEMVTIYHQLTNTHKSTKNKTPPLPSSDLLRIAVSESVMEIGVQTI